MFTIHRDETKLYEFLMALLSDFESVWAGLLHSTALYSKIKAALTAVHDDEI